MARTSIATDNFNRAGPALGSNWSNLDNAGIGDVIIDSSVKFRGQYGMQPTERRCSARWVGAGTFSADQYSEVTVTGTGVSSGAASGIGVICRAGSGTGASRTYYEFLILGDGTVSPVPTVLAKVVSGTRTVLNSADVSWTDGDEISLECEGTTIRACQNGTALGGAWTVTDSSITTGNPGVIASGATMYGDDWVGGDITAASVIMSGGIDLADFVLSGSFAVGALSQLSSGFTLDDFQLSGVMGLAPGIVTTNPFKNWSGTLLPGVTVPNVVFLKLDRTMPLTLTNQITAGDAVMTITNAALITGTYYIMVSYNADGSTIGAELVLAA